jgi:agmatinase
MGRAIRDISVRFSAVSAPGQPGYFDLRSGLDRATCTVVDCGDVEIVPLLWETDFEMITGAVGAILAKGAFPLIAGGDHAVTFPCVRAFEGRGPITVVQIDAHLDYRDEAMGVRYGHGNVLRRVRELPFVERVISVGVRSLRTRREDAKAHGDDGNTIIPAWDLHAHGIDALAGLLPRNANVYVTFDIDAMDPAIAPGTGTPEVGGLSYEQARRLIEIVFAENRIVGFDLVEMNPSLDVSEITALLSAQIMLEAIGFLQHRLEGTPR